jgi:UDP-GlcNAc3NAcA epimerase
VKIFSVVGNRPQFIKSGPVSVALRAAGVEEVVLHTGQHWDAEMSQVFFAELELPEPAYSLDLHTADTAAMEPAIRAAVETERPDWVLVYGDTNSTLAGASAAGGVPVAHVEAGRRRSGTALPSTSSPPSCSRRTSDRRRRSAPRASAGGSRSSAT